MYSSAMASVSDIKPRDPSPYMPSHSIDPRGVVDGIRSSRGAATSSISSAAPFEGNRSVLMHVSTCFMSIKIFI